MSQHLGSSEGKDFFKLKASEERSKGQGGRENLSVVKQEDEINERGELNLKC